MVSHPQLCAHHPLRDWLAQRLTAAVMALYTLVLLAALIVTPPADRSAWRQIFLSSWMKFATLLFFVSLSLHAWIGMRNIFMDYVKNDRLRRTLYVLVAGALFAYAIWTVRILWGP